MVGSQKIADALYEIARVLGSHSTDTAYRDNPNSELPQQLKNAIWQFPLNY